MTQTGRKKNVSVLLDPKDWERFDDYAWANKYPKAELARKWLMERLDQETANRPVPQETTR